MAMLRRHYWQHLEVEFKAARLRVTNPESHYMLQRVSYMVAMKEATKAVGVAKKRRDVLAVEELNFEGNRREIFHRLDPNGDWTTTLVRIPTG